MRVPSRVVMATGVMFILSTGCATKQFVRKRVDPLAQRVEQTEKKNQEQDAQLEELQRSVSAADERARGADSKAVEAASLARDAQSAAQKAQLTANDATAAAGRVTQRVQAVEERLQTINRYQLAASQTVLFAFNSSRLDSEGQALLDQLAGQIPSGAPYVIEVQGFTDSTGPSTYNVALSQRRAEAVARYLVVKHGVPVRAIHILGVGSESPVAENRTREGRKLNRRVEVRLFVSTEATLARQ